MKEDKFSLEEYISISRACSIKNYSVKKVLAYLADNRIIPKKSQRKESVFHFSEKLNIISNGKGLKVKPTEFYNFIDKEVDISNLIYTDYNKELLDSIVSPEIRFSRITNIQNKRLLFIDAEFKEGNYHEIAWELWENGILVDKQYMLERAHFMKRIRSGINYNRYNRLKKYNQQFMIKTRKEINYLLKKVLKTVDYIVAHNAYGERNALIKNGMWYEKSKFLCTSKISEDFMLRSSPSLMDLVDGYKIKYNSHFMHYAHEDTRLTALVFFAMIADAKERYNGKT
jgi:hypothetical protein